MGGWMVKDPWQWFLPAVMGTAALAAVILELIAL
jgi:hypothetical protein